jgi:hypothetical protein
VRALELLNLAIAIYLAIGLLLAGLAFLAMRGLRKLGEPDIQSEAVHEVLGTARVVLTLALAWPMALVFHSRNLRAERDRRRREHERHDG